MRPKSPINKNMTNLLSILLSKKKPKNLEILHASYVVFVLDMSKSELDPSRMVKYFVDTSC